MSGVGGRRSAIVGVGVVMLLVLLAGCSKSDGSSSASGGASTTVAAGKLFPDNFTSVCQGVGQSKAREYAKAGTHKLLYIQTYEDHLQDDSQVLPSDWAVQFDANKDAYANVDLVGCGVRTGAKFAKECTGYKDDDGKDAGQKVKLYTATYKVTAYAAKSGSALGSTVLHAGDTDCPMLQSFDKGQKVATVYQAPTNDAIVAFLKPYAQP